MAIPITYGTAYRFSDVANVTTLVKSLDSTHFVVVRSASKYIYAVIGTNNNGVISYGSDYLVRISTAANENITLTVIDSTHFIVAYNSSSTSGRCKMGTVTGTVISYSNEAIFSSAAILSNNTRVEALNSTTFIITYVTASSGTDFLTKIGTINGTDINFGSSYLISNSGVKAHTCITVLDSTHFVAAYFNGNYGYLRLGVIIGGNQVNYGNENTLFNNGIVNYIDIKKIDSTRFVIGYKDSSTNSILKIGTLNPDTNAITCGSGYVFDTNTTINSIKMSVLDLNNFVITYSISTARQAVICSINNDAIIVDTPYIFYNYIGDVNISTLNPLTFVIAYPLDISYQGYCILGTLPAQGKKINGITYTKWNGIAISKFNGV